MRGFCFPRLLPNFFRASNGLDIAVETIPNLTVVGIANPENTDYWEVFFYGIDGAETSDDAERKIREKAIAAVLNGRFVPHQSSHNKAE